MHGKGIMPDDVTFEVRTLENLHSCNGVNKVENQAASAKRVWKHILSDIRENPNMTPRDIIKYISNRYALTLDYKKAWRAREYAREQVFDNIEDSYDLVLR
ncbi:hypothetical protein Droror1_Dr00007864 [Drosera rotundifolia]